MKVLIATDGSDFSAAAADKCCALFGNVPDAEIMVVSAYEPLQPIAAEPFAVSAEYYHEMTKSAKLQAEHHADATQARIKENCPNAHTAIEILEGKPSARIVEFAEEWGADTIIVGSHGRGFWGRLLGSVSNAVVNHAPCSVLVVRRETE